METGRQFDNEELIGSVFAGRYHLTRLLSSGANTVILDADDLESQRPVTIKLLQPDLAVSATFRDRFDSTIRNAAALSHPNIAAIFDWGAARFGPHPTVYVVTERLTGGSLRDLYDRGRRLSPSQALAVGLEACRGLDHAHRRGFIHTELTPSKLVFGDDRRLRIVDFGLASLLGEHQWENRSELSTHVARYASPEQAQSLPVDATTDVYALCLGLVEGVTGELPFAADSTVATLAARVGRLMPVSADLGPLASVFERAGRPEAEDRSTAAQFGRGLMQAAPKLPRPDPLPLLATSLFETPPERLRAPDDPTGGLTRQPASELKIVVSDEDAAPGGRTTASDDDEEGEPAVGDVVDTPPDDGLADDAAPDDAVLGPDRTIDVPDHDDEHADDDHADDEQPGDEHADDEQPGDEHADDEQPGDEQPDDEQPDDADPGDEQTGSDPLDLVVLDVDDPVPSQPVPVVAPGGGEAGVSTTAAGAAPIVPAAMAGPADEFADGVPDDEPPARRGVLRTIALSVLLLVALMALVVGAVRLLAAPTFEVPDLAGLEQDEALLQIAEFEWDVQIDEERSDDEPRPGHVVRTVPPAEERVARGEPFLLVVSAGPLLRTLPDLVGLNVVAATTRLEDLALVPVIVEEFDEDIPLGRVIDWSVVGAPELGAGDQVEPGVEIEVISSAGPALRIVPDFSGAVLGTVVTELARLRLVLAIPEERFDDDVPAGGVISQDPEPGTELERGGEVSVVISKGPDLVPIPDVIGQPFEDAFVELARAGFEPTLSFGTSEGVVIQLSVNGNRVSPGTLVRRGDVVGIWAL